MTNIAHGPIWLEYGYPSRELKTPDLHNNHSECCYHNINWLYMAIHIFQFISERHHISLSVQRRWTTHFPLQTRNSFLNKAFAFQSCFIPFNQVSKKLYNHKKSTPKKKL